MVITILYQTGRSLVAGRLYQFMLIGILHQADHGVGVCFAENILAVGFHSAFGNK